ncbi:MAG: DNA cytosine methyltransferase, partial [Candidatus Scalindua sp.]
VYDIKLSIEKDGNAHKTLELRSFYRQFSIEQVPDEYYKVLQESNLSQREFLKNQLFEKYKPASEKAKQEAWHAELGGDNFPEKTIDHRIINALKGEQNWVLIGGPPCQAYSLAGRSRVGGVHAKDHRVYLYKEYLRIIARHHPAVFVMENVKGLLSAKVNGEKVFHWMLNDLKNPGSVFDGLNSPDYTIFSLVNNEVAKDADYLIKCEDYGIPQKRHRIILLGVRNEIDKVPGILSPIDKKITLKSVIDKLPKIRSGINRKFLRSEIVEGKKKRYYKNVEDSANGWESLISNFRTEIIKWNGFSKKELPGKIKAPLSGVGSEFVKCTGTIDKKHPLFKWYIDNRLEGVPNHESRTHLVEDLKRYLFASIYTAKYDSFPWMSDYENHGEELLPDHENAKSGKFADRFRVQLPEVPATTVTSHISKDGHYFIHYDPLQCRSLTVREASRIQTFPDNYLFCGPRTSQFHQVGNAVPPLLAYKIGHIVKILL